MRTSFDRFKVLFPLVGMLLILPGCGRKKTAAWDPPPARKDPDPPREDPRPPREDPRPPRKVDPDAPYRCAQDSHCVTTCARGAINRAFYFANRKWAQARKQFERALAAGLEGERLAEVKARLEQTAQSEASQERSS